MQNLVEDTIGYKQDIERGDGRYWGRGESTKRQILATTVSLSSWARPELEARLEGVEGDAFGL